MKKLTLFIFIVFLSVTALAQKANWEFDKAHTKIQFIATHMLIAEVVGNFKEFDGKVITNGENLENAKISFTVNVNSINTDNEKRDGHLRSDDFFNAEKFPSITFQSTSVKKVSDNQYKMVGDFTIRDVTKPIELDVTYSGSVKDGSGKERRGYKIKGIVNRFDYNLKWNALLETGGAIVSKDIAILCNVELIKVNEETL